MSHETQQEVGEYLAGLPLDGPERLQRELEAEQARRITAEQDRDAALIALRDVVEAFDSRVFSAMEQAVEAARAALS